MTRVMPLLRVASACMIFHPPLGGQLSGYFVQVAGYTFFVQRSIGLSVNTSGN